MVDANAGSNSISKIVLREEHDGSMREETYSAGCPDTHLVLDKVSFCGITDHYKRGHLVRSTHDNPSHGVGVWVYEDIYDEETGDLVKVVLSDGVVVNIDEEMRDAFAQQPPATEEEDSDMDEPLHLRAMRLQRVGRGGRPVATRAHDSRAPPGACERA